jgi:serine/threonine protein kinase
MSRSTIGVEELRRLFKSIATFDCATQDRTHLRRVRQICDSVDDWRQVLSAIPLDKSSFHLEVGVRRADAIAGLTRWCDWFTTNSPGRTRQQAEAYGYLAVLLLTLITMSHAAEGVGKAAEHDCGLCRRLVADDAVRSALLNLYAPDDEPNSDARQARDEWARILPESLQFYRHGTTSLILSGQPGPSSGRQITFALKCVLLPYSNISVIASTTRTYAADHNARGSDGQLVRQMVHVWASTSRWILMDLAEGNTLAEEFIRLRQDTVLPKRASSPAGNVRLDLIRRLGLPLLHALGELHAQGKRHEDLSPTNIIVRREPVAGGGEDYKVTFIDFGRNYLYTRAVGGLEGIDGSYIAPEVRDNADDVAGADLYSLGRILVTLGDVGENKDGTIPDRFYGQAPLIARFIEDLVDAEPERRLIVFRMAPDNPDVYGSLALVLRQELDVTQAALVEDTHLRQYAVPSDRQTVGGAVKAFFPFSREPRKQRRIYRVRKEQKILGNPQRTMYARWLLVFSRLAAINFWVTAMVCVYWLFRDVGIDILNPQQQVVLKLMGAQPNAIPLIDDLRQPDYRLGDIVANLPARVVALSFAFAAIRFYHNILSGVTTRVAGTTTLFRTTAEIAFRTLAVWSSWLVLAANLIQPRWWPLGTAIGYSGVVVCNFFLASFATRTLEQARRHGLSTVPPAHQKVTGLDEVTQWRVTMFFYTAMVWGFGTAIYVGLLKDTYVYALVVVLVNIGLLYMITCGIRAFDVRIGLNRCTLAAERLHCEAEANSGLARPTSEPVKVLVADPV